MIWQTSIKPSLSFHHYCGFEVDLRWPPGFSEPGRLNNAEIKGSKVRAMQIHRFRSVSCSVVGHDIYSPLLPFDPQLKRGECIHNNREVGHNNKDIQMSFKQTGGR